jgi:hypothetical protein
MAGTRVLYTQYLLRVTSAVLCCIVLHCADFCCVMCVVVLCCVVS